jgi:hypothetical protein
MKKKPSIETIIANAEQVSPDWLTAVLKQQGALPEGHVVDVRPGAVQSTFVSSVWRLDVDYSQNASALAPQRLFLKCSNPALAPEHYNPQHVQQEIVFYQKVAPAMAQPFTIPCYAADYDANTSSAHLLLKDVSDMYGPCSSPPSIQNYQQAVDALASLHAFWWDHPRLGVDIGQYPTPAQRQQDCISTQTSTAAFLTLLGDSLPRPWRKIYENAALALPDLFQRHASGKNLTLVHGDAHLGNFLFPIEARAGQAVMLDWQFWHPTVGGTDLAFLLAAESETETRRALEQALLRRYHQHLLDQGVRGYTWQQCWDYYRLSVILMSIFIPVWRWSAFHWEADHTAIQRSMTAFEDLQCADLL